MSWGLDIAELWFSSAGRIGRRAYAAAAGLQLLIGLGWRILSPSAWPWWAGLPLYALVLFSAGCVTSKRLHDRGHTGWWGLLLVSAVVVLWWRGADVLGAAGWRHWIAAGAGLVVGSSAVQLLVLRGQPGFNRWGPQSGGPG